jgi:hypothetical protein
MVSTNRPVVYASGGYDFSLKPMETLVLKPSLWQDIRLPHQFLWILMLC